MDDVLRSKPKVRNIFRYASQVQRADPADGSFPDAAFMNAVLGKVRQWTFEPPAGRTVEVLYPFVFVAPS